MISLKIFIPTKEELDKQIFHCLTQYQIERGTGAQKGTTMAAFEEVVSNLLIENGVQEEDIIIGSATVPGYFRPTKKWDLLIKKSSSKGNVLLGIIEFKSMLGSVGKNINNRVEEAVGSGYDFLKANEKLQLSTTYEIFSRPFVGYVYLMGQHEDNLKGGKLSQKYFDIDDSFISPDGIPSNYTKRLEILAQRLVESGLYSAASLILADSSSPLGYRNISEDLNFYSFIARLIGEIVPKYHTTN